MFLSLPLNLELTDLSRQAVAFQEPSPLHFSSFSQARAVTPDFLNVSSRGLNSDPQAYGEGA